MTALPAGTNRRRLSTTSILSAVSALALAMPLVALAAPTLVLTPSTVAREQRVSQDKHASDAPRARDRHGDRNAYVDVQIVDPQARTVRVGDCVQSEKRAIGDHELHGHPRSSLREGGTCPTGRRLRSRRTGRRGLPSTSRLGGLPAASSRKPGAPGLTFVTIHARQEGMAGDGATSITSSEDQS